MRAIDRIAKDPTPGPGKDIRSLQGVSGLWRMRVGDWHLIFTIRTEERIIEIVAVRPRGEAYRRP
ncbi:MAG TPA: type II toxin-antitoxin system RelE/ParE family toxin [Alicyclobacillus sp.]|nr:type II toxin-antitoxin system RelE/ParE family toxin [Alicyclobacillus sp.]